MIDHSANLPAETGVEPRIGIAWSPTPSGDLVIRAGYGLYRSAPFRTEKKRSVQVLAEAFNTLNHTNFQTVNNTPGTFLWPLCPVPQGWPRES